MAALRAHWPEYLSEAAALGLFMVSACSFGVLLNHPSSPLNQSVESDFARRVIGGIAMGLTALLLIHSPMGKRSGAHMNPAVTLTYWRLGKIQSWDAFWYVVFQFAGGVLGVAIAREMIGDPLSHSAVTYVTTEPGTGGLWAALLAEFVISAILMITVLTVSNHRGLSRFTPYFAATLVALFITFESPVSGMSMNPARSAGSAANAMRGAALWIYFAAPLAGMMAASLLYQSRAGLQRVFCAKLHHHNNERCIFRCRFGEIA
ncbi:MAG: aquaporin family protein [Acidobacteria bacterium]|nr:aquaporin family protein [Acidobacteriota bacterium]